MKQLWRDRRVRIGAAIFVALLISLLIWRSCHKPAAGPAADIVVSVKVAKAERGTITNESMKNRCTSPPAIRSITIGRTSATDASAISVLNEARPSPPA